jgi:4-amino-4-deoxy-L-arabinose transferase-like glycosyltransferase
MKNRQPILINSLIIFISGLLFLPFLGSVHLFDWDENIFAESAREMLVTGNFYKVQSNFLPFEEKPPFFFWLQAIAMTIFGVNEFAARFPNAVAGAATLVLLYNLGRKYFSEKFGLYWVLAYMGSFLPHFYFRTAMIDPTFNLFIFSGIFTLALFATTPREESGLRNGRIALAGLLIGFAILTKGPVALLITMLTAAVFVVIRRQWNIVSIKEALFFILPMTLVACAWFGVEAYINGPWFIKEFILYQIFVFRQPHSGHSGPFFFHFPVLLLGCFPVSIYIFKAFRNYSGDSSQQKAIKLCMIIMMSVVLLVFSLVKTKLVHYSSLCYFSISFLAAYTLEKYSKGIITFGKGFKFTLGILGILIGGILFGAVYFLKIKDELLPALSELIKDDFALGNLSTPIQVSSWEFATGIIFTVGIIFTLFNLKKDFIKASLTLFIITVFTVQLTTYSIVPKIETMIQAEAINFYKEKGQEDAYLGTYGFKSFGYLFYGLKKPQYRPESLDENWLMHGETDKPVYLVAKAYNSKALDENPRFKKLYSKSGYNFYYRSLDR